VGVRVLEAIKVILESYRRLLEVAPKMREVDSEVFVHLERAAQELAVALTSMRIRGILDLDSERELDELLSRFS